MANNTHPENLAQILAEIASTISDKGTAIRLLELVEKLLGSAGLHDVPPGDDLPP
jgi:hypothetical protein